MCIRARTYAELRLQAVLDELLRWTAARCRKPRGHQGEHHLVLVLVAVIVIVNSNSSSSSNSNNNNNNSNTNSKIL